MYPKSGLPRADSDERISKPPLKRLDMYRRPAWHALPLLFVLLLLYGLFSLATPGLLTWPGSRWQHTLPVNWFHYARASFRTRTVTSGVVETSEEQRTPAGPRRINVLNVDLTNANVRLGVVQQHNRLFGSGETLSSMATRTGAVAGINGDFFEINGTGDSLGMVEINGQIWQSPGQAATLGVTSSGRLTLGPETFSGAVTVGDTSYSLAAVNRYGAASANHLTLFTPAFGASLPLHKATLALLQPATGSSTMSTVESIQAGVKRLPVLHDQKALVGGGSAGAWLAAHLQRGARVKIDERITPDNNLVQALGGGPMIIKNGAIYQDPHPPFPGKTSASGPLTAIGITRDGKRALLVVCDGRRAGSRHSSRGFTRAQMGTYLLAHGAYQAMLFDGGGSSEMVARLPGQHRASVINAPSEGRERKVANGLFLYSTESHPGPATSVVINDSRPLAALAGTTLPVSAYALDALGNPAASPAQVSVTPANLAQISHGNLITALQAGRGQLLARAGRAQAVAGFQVVDHLATLHLTPARPDLPGGQQIQFHAWGSTADGTSVVIPDNAVHWSVGPPSLGSITASGLFTASPSALETGAITAILRGSSAVASVAVGQVAQTFGSLTKLQYWGVSNRYLNVWPRNVPVPGPHMVPTGSILINTHVKRRAADPGSLELRYHFIRGPHVAHLNPYPDDPATFQLPLRNGKQPPQALGIWVKNTPAGVRGQLILSLGLYESDNTPLAIQLGTIISNGWAFFKAQLPHDLAYPLRLNYLSLVSMNPPANEEGSVYLCNLQAFYAPRLVG